MCKNSSENHDPLLSLLMSPDSCSGQPLMLCLASPTSLLQAYSTDAIKAQLVLPNIPTK